MEKQATLPVGLTNPTELLKKESAAMRNAVTELDNQIANALVQKANLLVMAEAFDREIERLDLCAAPEAMQLEFNLD